MFTNVCGLFLHYADEKVPDTVANWNVRRLGLHRENRCGFVGDEIGRTLHLCRGAGTNAQCFISIACLEGRSKVSGAGTAPHTID